MATTTKFNPVCTIIMKSIVREIDKGENLLVYTFVFYAIWAFAGGFMGFKGGLMDVIQMLHGSIPVILFLFCVLLYYHSLRPKVYASTMMTSKSSLSIIFALFFMGMIPIMSGYGLQDIGLFLDAIIVAAFFTIRNDLKVRVVDVFIRVLAIIFFLSAIEWLVWRLTGFHVAIAEVSRYKITYMQTLFNFIPISSEKIWVDIFMIGRFQSIASEPGAVGTVSAFMLFATANSKSYKYEYIIFWISGILSFSYAFYVMAALSFAVQFSKKNLKYLIVGAIIVVLLYSYFADMFNVLILDRFNAEGHGNNRINDYMQIKFNQAWEDGSLWFGKGNQEFDAIQEYGGNAGVQVSIYQYGILGVAAMVISYTIIFFNNLKSVVLKNKNIVIAFFVVFWLSFYQRQNITTFFNCLIFFTMPLFCVYKEKEQQ